MPINNSAELYYGIAKENLEKLESYREKLQKIQSIIADRELSRDEKKAIPKYSSSWENIMKYLSQQSDPLYVLHGLYTALEHLYQKVDLDLDGQNAFSNAAHRRSRCAAFFHDKISCFFLSEARTSRNFGIRKMRDYLDMFKGHLDKLDMLIKASHPASAA